MGMVSSLVGGAGASAAAQAQAKMMAQIADEWHQVGQMQYGWMSPYMNAGTTALTAQMQMLANPMNQEAALNDYYSGPQYDQQMQQAQYATNANAEATGGLGNTATGNAIANTSTQLGQQYLHGLTQQRNETFNQLGGLSKQGLSASTSMGNFAHQDMQGRASALTGQGAANAQKAQAPYRAVSSGIRQDMGLYTFGSAMDSAKSSGGGGGGKALKTAATVAMVL